VTCKEEQVGGQAMSNEYCEGEEKSSHAVSLKVADRFIINTFTEFKHAVKRFENESDMSKRVLNLLEYKVQITCVEMPSLMAARWLSQNSGPIFRRLWTKAHRIKSACAGVSVVCNAVFRLTMACCVPEIFAIKWRSCAKSRRNFDAFGPPNFGGGGVKGPPKFLTDFINLSHHRIYGKVW